MTKVWIFVFALLLTCSLSSSPGLSTSDKPIQAVRVLVVPFVNRTGAASLDWLSYGFQDAFSQSLTYLKGFDPLTFLDLPRDPSFSALSGAAPAELFALAERGQIDQVWTGEFRGDGRMLTAGLTVVEAATRRSLARREVEAPLDKLRDAVSRAVLEIVGELGSPAAPAAAARVSRPRAASPEAWRLKIEGLVVLKRFMDAGPGPGQKSGPELLEESRQALEKASGLDPSFAEAWSDLGWVHLLMRQLDKARAAFNRSLETDPFLVDALIGLGMMSAVFNPPQAMNYLRRAVEVNPSASRNGDAVWDILLSVGRKKDALELVSVQLGESSRSGKLESIRLLMGTGGKDAVPILKAAANDPDGTVRGRVMDGLWYIGDRTVIPLFIEALRDPDGQVRQIVIQALGTAWTGDPRIGPALTEMLTSRYPGTREISAWALGSIREARASGALIELTRDPASGVRRSAAAALGSLGDKVALPCLTELLKDPDGDVCAAAANSLRLLQGRTSLPRLLSALRDADTSLRRRTARALEALADQTAVPFLLEAIKDPDKEVRKSAALGLSGAAVPALGPVLAEALKSPDETVRLIIVACLSRIGDDQAVKLLMEAVKDPAPDVRARAIQGLSKMGVKNLGPVLMEALKDPQIWVRSCAVRALGKTGDASALPELLKALEDPEEEIRRSAAQALGELRLTASIPSLLAALSDPAEDIPFDAAVALAKMGSKGGLDQLKDGLKSYAVRDEAAWCLIQLGESDEICGYFLQSSDLYAFSQIRKKLLVSDRLNVLFSSPDPFLRSSGRYFMALRAREEGRYEDQLRHAAEALGGVDARDRTAFAVLCSWLKAQAEAKLGRPQDALGSLRKAEDLLAELGISVKERQGFEEPFEEYTSFLKGEFLALAGESRAAMAAYEAALKGLGTAKRDYALKDPAERLEVMVQTSLGALQIKMGKAYLEQAVEKGRNFQAADSLEIENEEKRYLELARQKIAEGNYEESQKLVEELNLRRAQYLSRKLNIRFADAEKERQAQELRSKQDEIEAMSRKLESLAREKRDGGPPQAQDELARLEAEKNGKRRELQLYLTNLKRTHPDLAALLGAKPVELTAVQERLPPKAILLQYLLLPDKLVVFAIRGGGVDVVESPIEKTVLKEKVIALRRAIFARAEGTDSRRIKPLTRELYDLLIKPVDAGGRLKGMTMIGISPNGFLHQLPFGVLTDDAGGFLIDRFDLFYVNSTSLLGVALDRERPGRAGPGTLLAFSNPDGTLAYADTEVADVAKLFAEKAVYSRNEARKDVLLKKPSRFSVLHLSTHAVFDPGDSTKSYLVMSDGRLTAEEIWGLPLEGTSLTVLSACETGMGEVLSGDDVVSLENAFIYAGSATVIATLWKVADESTAELMDLFYRGFTAGRTKAEAMSQAQRKLRAKYEHPFFWAAFTLRGDWN